MDLRYPGAENFSFVTDGIEAAVALAQQVAGEKNVGVAAGTVAPQCLEAGLLDDASYLRIIHSCRLTRRHSPGVSSKKGVTR
jgi:hypothetical protein